MLQVKVPVLSVKSREEEVRVEYTLMYEKKGEWRAGRGYNLKRYG
jgi:hypothetical protein